MPAAARSLLRRGVVSREGATGPLRWPVEDRFVTFAEQVRAALEASGPERALPWWPDGHDCAVVLTHDVEGPFGLSHLLDVLALERARGFRSSISFVGDTYTVPDSLLREVREAGFEVALHGWRHDGRLFESRAQFDRQLPGMNARLRQWGAVGFRSPMTHRVPSWMQGLEVEWDSSFFDTDPFEPMPGGVMTIWPYVMGRFVELPYTLPQDHTLIETLGETSLRYLAGEARLPRRPRGHGAGQHAPGLPLSRGKTGAIRGVPRRARPPPGSLARPAERRSRLDAGPVGRAPGGRVRSDFQAAQGDRRLSPSARQTHTGERRMTARESPPTPESWPAGGGVRETFV